VVKLKDIPEYDKLDTILHELCDKHDFKLFVSGWTRKTYDVYWEEKKLSQAVHLARIESLATSNGEIRFFDDRASEFAHELGEAMEQNFGLDEALLIREKRPSD